MKTGAVTVSTGEIGCMFPEVTVCTRCANFKNLEPNSPRRDVWYNHLCMATPLPKEIDPYDGKVKPFSKNDFGQRHASDNEFEYCRNVNDGTCQKFRAK